MCDPIFRHSRLKFKAQSRATEQRLVNQIGCKPRVPWSGASILNPGPPRWLISSVWHRLRIPFFHENAIEISIVILRQYPHIATCLWGLSASLVSIACHRLARSGLVSLRLSLRLSGCLPQKVSPLWRQSLSCPPVVHNYFALFHARCFCGSASHLRWEIGRNMTET